MTNSIQKIIPNSDGYQLASPVKCDRLTVTGYHTTPVIGFYVIAQEDPPMVNVVPFTDEGFCDGQTHVLIRPDGSVESPTGDYIPQRGSEDRPDSETVNAEIIRMLQEQDDQWRTLESRAMASGPLKKQGATA